MCLQQLELFHGCAEVPGYEASKFVLAQARAQGATFAHVHLGDPPTNTAMPDDMAVLSGLGWTHLARTPEPLDT